MHYSSMDVTLISYRLLDDESMGMRSKSLRSDPPSTSKGSFCVGLDGVVVNLKLCVYMYVVVVD